jgi:hypothetical protein
MKKFFLQGALLMQLSSMNLEDQYSKSPNWNAFSSVPAVMVLAGEKASEDATRWGLWLQKNINGDFVPTKQHLQILDSREKAKVIAVATLPEVPGIFKGLFRRGFRSKAEMGVILDFGAALSSQLHYKEDSPDPAIAILPKGALNIEEAKIFVGPSHNQDLQKNILETLKRCL